MENSLLLMLLVIPAMGAVVGALLPKGSGPKYWALLVSTVTLVVAAVLTGQFFSSSDGTIGYGLKDRIQLDAIGMSFALSMDAISLWLVLLTALLAPLAILFSFASIKEREKEYYAWMQVLLMAMLGVFVARDLL